MTIRCSLFEQFRSWQSWVPVIQWFVWWNEWHTNYLVTKQAFIEFTSIIKLLQVFWKCDQICWHKNIDIVINFGDYTKLYGQRNPSGGKLCGQMNKNWVVWPRWAAMRLGDWRRGLSPQEHHTHWQAWWWKYYAVGRFAGHYERYTPRFVTDVLSDICNVHMSELNPELIIFIQ